MSRGRFSWFLNRDRTEETTKQPPRRPVTRDITEGLVCNSALTQGLFRNTFPGLKLAGSLAYAPIAHPVAFMGLPTPKADDAKTQEALGQIIDLMSRRMASMHIMVPRDGTVWIWPKFDMRAGRLIWEIIPDESVSDIVKSADTGEIVEIYTDEQFKIATGENKTTYARRRRTFTPQNITARWEQTGGLSEKLMDRTMRNVLGIFPIPFANLADADESRGHSDYERILYNLKGYHDISEAWQTILAQFKPKLVQEVDNLKDWLANNGYTDISCLDPWGIDFIVNLRDKERAEMVWLPSDASAPYREALGVLYDGMVEGSGIPEIFWGQNAAGNQASVDDQRQAMVRYVDGKRTQLNDSYSRLFSASLELLGMVYGFKPAPFVMGWNRLSAISEAAQAQIFQQFAAGLAAILPQGGITPRQLYNLWNANYPEATENDFAEFEAGIAKRIEQNIILKGTDPFASIDDSEAAGGSTKPLDKSDIGGDNSIE